MMPSTVRAARILLWNFLGAIEALALKRVRNDFRSAQVIRLKLGFIGFLRGLHQTIRFGFDRTQRRDRAHLVTSCILAH